MMRKKYYQKLAFMGMLLIVLLAFQNYTGREKENFPEVKFITKRSAPLNLTEFDPNDLDARQWEHLGFSEKQISTILNYKKMIGGKFTTKDQLKKCYAISAEKFSELKSYILLPEVGKGNHFEKLNKYEKKEIVVSKKFNPDRLSATEWMNFGFSEKQAEAILKYKNYLGGSFVSKEKFKECFIISPAQYRQLEPYLMLPVKTPEGFKSYGKNYIVQSKTYYHNFDPNSLDSDGWQSLGFSERQANTIVNYRDRNLRGSFKSLEDIKKCFVISTEKFHELSPYIRLSTNTTQKQEAKQETDYSKTDLNTITFKQLIEFGLDEKSAGSILGFRKKLGGFVNTQQIMDTYNIDKDIVQKLINTCLLNTSNVAKYTLTDAPEEWLKNHPYFKYSADKIIFYRISNFEEKKIWKLLKLKPEYETRMKLYIK